MPRHKCHEPSLSGEVGRRRAEVHPRRYACTLDVMTDGQERIGLTRRQTLAAMAALCGLGAVASAETAQAAPRSSSTTHGGSPSGDTPRAKTLRVRLASFPALNAVGGAAVVGRLNGINVAVVRTGPSTYVALDRRCPHAGGIVTASDAGWVCPLHGSRFDLDGDKVSGLTPSGLRRLRSRLSRGFLVISP